MKNNHSKIHFTFAVLSFCLLFTASCEEETVKLTANDRVAIDTLSTNAINKLTLELDKQCQDKADSLRKFLVDSLVAVREREIIMQTLPTH
ncbi:MAG: hypothetical protein JNL70_20450 [Saprospiraceae bacterium]|nr:hypothetical protein [Saprospiraceae bacterium]